MSKKKEKTKVHDKDKDFNTDMVEINIDSLVQADWNYKQPATEEQLKKLCNSILRDKSIGVLPVRELKNGKYEVIDGNHRLEAIKKLGWQVVPCESFGKITKAQAITIARRRNYQWFEDDPIKFAEIFKNDVLPEISFSELEEFMPETREQLEDISKLLDFDWNEYEAGSGPKSPPVEQNTSKVSIEVSKEAFEMWNNWKNFMREELGENYSEGMAFESAVATALVRREEMMEVKADRAGEY